MKKLLAVALVLCFLAPCALAEEYKPWDQEFFEEIWGIWEGFYLVSPLPEATVYDEAIKYVFQDYMILLRLDTDKKIDFVVLQAKEWNFNMISMMEIVWCSVYGENNWDLIMGLTYEYIHTGESVLSFNDFTSAAVLRNNENKVEFIIMQNYKK